MSSVQQNKLGQSNNDGVASELQRREDSTDTSQESPPAAESTDRLHPTDRVCRECGAWNRWDIKLCARCQASLDRSVRAWNRQSDDKETIIENLDIADAPVSSPLFTLSLLAVNIGVWLIMQVSGGFFNGFFVNDNTALFLRFGGLYGQSVANGEYWRLFTSMFLHAGAIHLALNSFILLSLGNQLEPIYGNTRFIIIYLLAGLAGSTLSFLFNETTVSVGASGAIFGLAGALLAYFLVHRNKLLDGLASLAGLAFFIIYNFIVGLSNSGIDNWAHLGGFIGGFILGFGLMPRYLYENINTQFGIERRISGYKTNEVSWVVAAIFATVLAVVVLYKSELGKSFLNSGGSSEAHTPAQVLEPISDGGTTWNTYYSLGAESYNRGEYDAAISYFSKAIELKPNDADIYHIRGLLYYATGEYDRAIADYDKAIDLNPNDANGYRNLQRMAYAAKGN